MRTRFAGGASARVKRVLVGRKIKDGRITPKDVLCPVAVVDIPVDDQNSLCSVLGLSISRRDRGIIEQTKAHRGGDGSMMSRWTYQRKRAAAVFMHRHIHCCYRSAGSQNCNIVGFTADSSVSIDLPRVPFAQEADVPNHFLSMTALNVTDICGRRLDLLNPRQQSARLQRLQNRVQPKRVLRVTSS